MKLIIIATLLLNGLASFANIADHVIYDAQHRYRIENISAITSVSVNHYYAFSDIGLIKTLIAKREIIEWKPGKEGYMQTISDVHGSDYIYTSHDVLNEALQLQRNSLWILDVNIEKEFKGTFETNRVLVAMKPTRAYSSTELPQNVLIDHKTKQIVLGMIKLDQDEFKQSFQGLTCYLKDDITFFDFNHKDNELFSMASIIQGEELITNITLPCYVAREIGIQPLKSINGEKSELIKLLEK